jgi:hypothetical protein
VDDRRAPTTDAGDPGARVTPVALVPGVPALLPEHASLTDPVADLRAACRTAVGRIAGPGSAVRVVAGPQGLRVAEHLLEEVAARATGDPSYDAVLVVGNGSARRTEKAPGHLDPRAATFDDAVDRALRRTDREALRAVDRDLADALLAEVDGLPALAGLVPPGAPADVLYADDPFGVQYWVVVWDALP